MKVTAITIHWGKQTVKDIGMACLHDAFSPIEMKEMKTLRESGWDVRAWDVRAATEKDWSLCNYQLSIQHSISLTNGKMYWIWFELQEWGMETTEKRGIWLWEWHGGQWRVTHFEHILLSSS